MSDTLDEDLLDGVTEIAKFYGKTKRQTQYLLEQRQIPAFKIGNRWHARKSTARKFIEKLEAEAA